MKGNKITIKQKFIGLIKNTYALGFLFHNYITEKMAMIIINNIKIMNKVKVGIFLIDNIPKFQQM